MSKFDAREYIKSKYNKTEKKNKTTQTTKSTDYARNYIKEKYRKKKADEFGFDTLETDLNSLGTTIKGIYDGWQTEETMRNTRSSIESMYNRLTSYQDYRKTYGITDGEKDIADLVNNYKTTLDNWDSLTSHYGEYKSADAYKKAEKAQADAEKRKKDMVNADLDVVKKEITDLEGMLKKANDYNSKVSGYQTSESAAQRYSGRNGFVYNPDNENSKKLKSAQKELNEYLKGVGYSSVDELQKALKDKQSFLDEAKVIQEKNYYNEQVANGNGKLGWEKYLADEQKRKEYAQANQPSAFEEGVIRGFTTSSDNPFSTIINNIIYDKKKDDSYQRPNENWTDEKAKLQFGARWLENPQKAFDYAAEYNNALANKKKNDTKEKVSASSTDGFWGAIGNWMGARLTAPLGLADYLDDLTDIAAGRDTIVQEGVLTPFEYSQTVGESQASALNEWSGTLNENIPVLGGKGIGDVYSLGNSIVDSKVSATTMGAFGTLVNYFGQAAASGVDDAMSRGADGKQALLYGTAQGLAEGIPEMISADKFLKLGKKADIGFLGKVRKQAREEGTEELVTALLSNATDNAIMQDKSQFNVDVKNLMLKGLTEEEAKEKVWLDKAEGIAFDALGGYLSGGLSAAPMAAFSNKYVKRTYSDSANDLIAQGLESGKDTDSYKLAEKLKQKVDSGKELSAKEIEKLVLANDDAYKTEIKADAESRLAKLGDEIDNSEVAEIIAKKSVGEELTKLELKTLQNSKYGNRVYNEINNEDLVSFTENMSEGDTNLFLSQYDGKADIDAYANSFNLVSKLSHNDFSQDYILEHRGVLSGSQVNAIYKANVLDSDKKLQKTLDAFKNKHKGAKFIAGTFDDSVIDYTNSVEGNVSTPNGNKVRWDKLNENQKKSIATLGEFFSGLGLDVTLISNGLERGINGAFEVDGNRVLLDVYAGIDKINARDLKDTIVPTASHETVHWAKNLSPEIYRKLDNFAFESLMSGTSKTEADILSERRRLMEKAHPDVKYTDAEVREEVIARACEDMLVNTEMFRKCCESMTESERETFIDKVKEIIQNIKDWINDFISKQKSKSPEAEKIREDMARFQEQVKLFEEMIEDAAITNQALKHEGVTGDKLANKTSKNIQEMARTKKTNIDKYGYNADNVSRANKKGELVNDYYYALNKSEWTRFYAEIADSGYLATANVGVVAPIVVNNKLIIAERLYTGRDAHDYVVTDAYELFTEDGDNFTLSLLQDALDKGDVSYDTQRIFSFVNKINRTYGRDELLARYNRDNSRFDITLADIEQSQGGSAIYRNSQEKIAGERLSFRDKPNIQGNDKKIKNSDRDVLEQRHKELQDEYNLLNKEVEEIKNSEKYKYFVDALSTTSGEELDNLVKEYGEWTHETGLYDKSKRMSEITGEQKDIRASIEDDRKNSRDAYMKSTETLSEKEKMDFVKKAVERYGTTNKVSLASYLMLNGKMLDFSEGQGYRVQDHREISEILDMPDSTEYSDGLIAFMNMGNIRLQTYGIDISQAPNQAQKTALRDVISQVMRENDEFSVDFSKTNGYTDGSVTYPKGTSSSKILEDIERYFKTGVVPEYNSSIAGFRYSDRDSLGNALSKGQKLYFADSKMRDDNGNLMVMYQGSQEEFFEFDRKKSSPFNLYGRGFYFTDSKSHAEQYGNVTRAYYLNIKNPIATYEGDSTITKAQLKKFLKVVAENEDYSIENYGTYDVDEIANSVYGKSDYAMIQDISATAIGDLVEAIELFNEVNGTTFDGLILATETIIFNSEQAKLTTNKNPTDNKDIRFSDRDNAYMDAVNKGDMDTAQRLVDEVARENGYRIKGHHGTDIRFTIFDREKSSTSNDFGQGFYFSSSEFEAEQYQKDDAFGDTYNKIDGIAYENALERIRDMGEDANDDALFTRIYNEEFDKELKRRTDEGVVINAYLKMENPFVVSTVNWITEEEAIDIAKNTMYADDVPDDIAIPDWIHSIKAYAKQHDGKVDTHHFANNMGHSINLTNALLHQGKYDGVLDYTVGKKFNTTSDYHAIALYPNKIKDSSPVTYDDDGNVIPLSKRFNKSNNDIRYSDRDYVAYDMTALLKETTIDKYLVEYASKSNPNYAQAYITYMRPNSFLELTTSGIGSQIAIENETKEFNREEFEDYTSNQIPIKLVIDHESGEVITHEGRHRMVALSREGIHDVPVLLFDYGNKYNKENIDEIKLIGQFNEFRTAIVTDAIPFNYANREAIIEKFGTMSKRQKTNERFGIRQVLQYSDRDNVSVYDKLGETDRLIKDNEKLKADVERLKERLKIERQVTHGNFFNQNQLDAVAGHIRNIANSNYDKKELVHFLNSIYQYIAHSPDLNWQDLYSQCYELADLVLDKSRVETVTNPYYKDILDDIRKTKISVNEQQIQNAKYRLGNKWRNSFFNKISISENGISLDSQWQEWASMYPNIFDADLSAADQLVELLDIYDSVRQASETVVEYDKEERTRWLAREIYNQYWNVSPIRTTADRYDKQIKRLNYEHRKAMQELRESRDEKLKEQHKIDKEKAQKLVKKIRERKDKEIAEVKQKSKEMMSAYKENAERKTQIQSILSTTTSLNKKLTTNSKESHIPESLKPVVINLIKAIDFSSKRLLNQNIPTQKDIALEKTFGKAKSMADDEISLKDAIWDASKMFSNAEKISSSDKAEDHLSLVTLDMELLEKIVGDDNNIGLIKVVDKLEKEHGENFVLEKMSLEDLKTLNAMVKSINHWASQIDKALAISHKEGIANLGMQTVGENDALGKYNKHGQIAEGVKHYFSWSNLLPVNAFERMGTAAQKVFGALQDAQDTLTFNQDKIEKFTEELFKGKEKDIKKWREDVKSFDLVLPNETKKTVRMPVSFVMTLHCVSKQEDALNHLVGEIFARDKDGNPTKQGKGMTIAEFKEKGKISRDLDNTILTQNLINQITSVLTKDQIFIADKLQEFMNTTGSEWGDMVSMALYGIKKFGIKDYFPITVTPSSISDLNTDDKKSTNFFAILNYGFTKSRNPQANQSIEIGDIFDVFSNHITMMAIYNAYALPIYDMARWYNFKTTIDGKELGVVRSLQNAFGEDATSYIKRLVNDLNGQHSSSRLGIINTLFKNTKVSMVGNSISVALLQPTAYVKASTIIPSKYLLKSALHVKDFGVKKGVEKAQKYCGIALRKSQGYFEMGVSKNTTTRILHDETKRDKLIEWSLKGAEWMDEKTWGMLWNACEFEVRDTHKELKAGSKEFYDTVAKRLREVIYKTQVVDSPLTKSDFMRSPDGLAKSITMFASEITVAYNMVSEAFVKANLDTKKYGKKESWKRNHKNITRNLIAYTVTSAVTSLLQTAVFAYRDDDDEEMDVEEFMKMWLTNFGLDWVLVGKIPYIKEIINYAQGYKSTRVDTLWMENATSMIKYWAKVFDGDSDASRKAIEYLLKTLSNISGIAAYNQYRDLMATLDTFGILTAEELEEWLSEVFG